MRTAVLTLQELASLSDSDPVEELEVARLKTYRVPRGVEPLLRIGRYAEAVRQAIQGGEHDRDTLTDLVFFAMHPDRCAPAGSWRDCRLIAKGSDYARYSGEWKRLRDTIVQPALEGRDRCRISSAGGPATASPPIERACCLLAPPSLATPAFVSLSQLGHHGAADEAVGLLYCGRAGFVDLGHLRDLADLTVYVYRHLNRNPVPRDMQIWVYEPAPTGGHQRVLRGEATIHRCPEDSIELARSIAYDAGLGHEIASYWQSGPLDLGGRHSSFSPEDLCSNFLGTLLAERALSRGGDLTRAMTLELYRLLLELKAQPPSVTQEAFDKINGRWVAWSFPRYGADVRSYLKRRNFTRFPWRVGHASDADIPAFVIAPMRDLSPFYSYVHLEGGRRLPKEDYADRIGEVKRDAALQSGDPAFDKP